MRVALLSAGSLLAATAASAADLSGGVVTAGAAQIGTQDAAGQTLITQTTQKAVINWADFSVAAGNSVRFAQPGASSVTLNRVTGGNVSKIDGSLSANGQLWVLNPNGVLVGATGRVSAAGFLATTRSISDSDFMAGQYGLSGGGDGAIGNAGAISVNGGYAVLAGKQVSNSGLIEANLGQIALGAGQGFTVDLAGDKLLAFAVTTPLEVLPSGGAITNTGTLRADGGRVLMTAKSAASVIDNVINTTGLVQAQSVALVNGEIVLDGGGAGTVSVNGTLDVSGAGAGQTGGKAIVLGDTVVVGDGGRIDARGATGGGEIYVGGGWQGASVLAGHASAIRTGIATGAVLDASAITSGNGGTVVAWSDVSNPLSVTHAHGTFLANGAGGGRIETSGHSLFTSGVRGSAINGLWLFDPYNVTIDNTLSGYGTFAPSGNTWTPTGSQSLVYTGDIEALLNADTNVTITTTSLDPMEAGDITLLAPIAKTTGASASLTLTADGGINLYDGISSTQGAGLSVNLTALAGDIRLGNGDGLIGTISVDGSVNATASNGIFSIGQGSAISAAAVGITAGNFQIDADINATYAISLTPADPTSNIRIQDGGFAAFGQEISFDSYTLAHLRAPDRIIGRSDGTGSVTLSLLDPNDPANEGVFGNGTPPPIGVASNLHILAGGDGGSITFDGYYSVGEGDGLQLKAGSNITLGETLSANVDGKLDLISGGTFVNLRGSSALSTPNSGRWVIQAADLTDPANNFNFLYSSDHAYFGKTFSGSGGPLVTADYSRYQFENQPTISVAPLSKTYGEYYEMPPSIASIAFGAVDASLYGGIFFQDTIGFTSEGKLQGTAAGTYNDIELNASDVADAQSHGYLIGSVTGGAFTVTQKALTVNLNSFSKTYDGSSTVNLTTGDFAINGLVGGDQIDISSVGMLSSANAGSRTLTTNLAANNYSGTSLGNYQLTIGPVTGGAYINTALVTTTLTAGKTYDGTNTASIGSLNFQFSGFAAGEGITVTKAGTFSSKDAGPRTVQVSFDPSLGSDRTLTGSTNLSNYQFQGYPGYGNFTVSGTGVISPAMLSLSGLSASNKTYDGTVTASVTGGQLVGVYNSDNVTLGGTGSGTFDSPNAGPRTVTVTIGAGGYQLAGTAAANYTLTAPGTLSATINQRTLSASLNSANSKTYDGTTAATFANGSVTVYTEVAGETITVSKTTGNFDNANAGGSKTVTATLAAGDFTPAGGTLLSNYVLPTSASYGYGTISQRSLTLAAQTDTRVYNGTTASNVAPVAVAATANTGLVGSDSVTGTQAFDTPNFGTRTLSVTGYSILDGNGGQNYSVQQQTASGQITAKLLTVDGLNGIMKTYDGTTAATYSGTPTLAGVVGQDNVSLSAGQIAANFATPDAGVDKSIIVTGYSLANNGLGNYALGTVFASNATIQKRLIVGSLVGTVSKVYDATTAATLGASNISLGNFASGEGAAFTGGNTTYTALYASPNAGSGINVSASFFASAFTPTGNTNLANYTFSSITGTVGVISQRTVSAALTGTASKTYDGSAQIGLAASNYALTNVVNGDAVALNNPATGLLDNNSAGSGKIVTASGLALSGNSASNYILSSTSASAAIGTVNQRAIGASLTGTIAKTYDGTSSATLGANNYLFGNTVSGDTLTLSSSSGTYDTKNAGSSKTVTFTGLTLGGSAAGNYFLASTTASGTVGQIDQRTVTASLSGSIAKDYDGTLGATIGASNYGLANVVSGDAVSLNNPTTGLYDSASAGTGKVVSTGGLAISGADAPNYVLANTSVSAAIGTINQRLLTAAILGTIQKTYDGSTTAALGTNYSLSNVVNGETVTLAAASGAYNSKDAGTGKTVTFASLTLGGSTAGNYTLGQTTALSGANGTIDPRALSGALTGTVSKVYDGTTVATIGAGNVTLSNFVAGEGAAFGGVSGSYATANAGSGIAVSATIGTAALVADAGTNLANYTGPGTLSGAVGTIGQRTVSAALTGTASKVYDGTATATLSNANYALANVVGGDSVTLNSPVNGAYESANAGTAKVVSVGGLALSGTAASNYILASTSTSGAIGTISQRTLGAQLTGTVAKTYDGTAAASFGPGNYSLSNLVTGDSVTLAAGAGSYDSKNAGTGKTVTFTSLSLGGASGANYTLGAASLSGAVGTINQRALTASLSGTVSKVYDGSTAATLGAGNVAVSNFVAGEGASFVSAAAAYATPNVGSGLTVSSTISTAALSANAGTDLANYTGPGAVSGAIGAISARTVSAALTGTATKIYDGTTTATLGNANYALTNVVSGDSLALNNPASATYDSANAGTGRIVSVGGLALSGTAASNYVLASTSTSGAIGTISQRTVGAQLTGTVAKTYDGTTAAALGASNAALSNLVAGDAVTLSAGSGAYDNRNAGTAKTVTFASLSLSGAAAANYTLGQTTSLSAAVGTISQRTLVASLSGTATKVYDGTTTASLANTSIALANTVAGDTVSVATPASGTFADRNVGTAKTVTAAGLALGGADAGNYTLASASIGAAIGSITAANLTYLANAATREQFVANPAFTGSVTGFVTGDTQANATTGTLAFQSNAVAGSVPGSYQINGSGLSAQNYVFTQAPGNATALTVTAASTGTTTEAVQTVVRTAAVTAAVTPTVPPPPPVAPPPTPTPTPAATDNSGNTPATNSATNGATAGTPAAQPVSNQLPPPAPPADAPPPPPVEVANAVPPPAPVAPLPPSPVPETAPPTPTDTADANDAVLAEAGAPPPAEEPAGEQRQAEGSTTAVAPGVNVAVNTPPRSGETPGIENRFSGTGDTSQW